MRPNLRSTLGVGALRTKHSTTESMTTADRRQYKILTMGVQQHQLVYRVSLVTQHTNLYLYLDVITQTVGSLLGDLLWVFPYGIYPIKWFR